MTGDGKILKLACLASLFVGFAALIYGVVLLVGNFTDIDAWITAAEGIAATALGVHSARLANVPSNTSKIRMIALVGALCALAIAAYVLMQGPETTRGQDVISVIVVGIMLVAVLYATRIVKEQLRK